MEKGIDHIGITVCYLCHDGKGNILFNKRGAKTRDEHGTWDAGGTVEETLRKEVKEEYCADILKHEFLGYRDLHREHDGKKTFWLTLDFVVLVDREKVKNGEPHKFDEIAWFTLDTLPSPLHSGFPQLLAKYKERLPNYFKNNN